LTLINRVGDVMINV